MLARRDITAREAAFWTLIDASHDRTDAGRRRDVTSVTGTLSAREIYHANTVIALFNFYNTFVDLNGVNELTSEGYDASGLRLATQGYGPPAVAATSKPTAKS